MKNILVKTLLVAVLTMFITSCVSNDMRKCNGRKGIKTQMGLM